MSAEAMAALKAAAVISARQMAESLSARGGVSPVPVDPALDPSKILSGGSSIGGSNTSSSSTSGPAPIPPALAPPSILTGGAPIGGAVLGVGASAPRTGSISPGGTTLVGIPGSSVSATGVVTFVQVPLPKVGSVSPGGTTLYGVPGSSVAADGSVTYLLL